MNSQQEKALMAMRPLPNPKDAAADDIAEGQRRYDLTFNALCNSDYLSPVDAYQRQLERLRVWLRAARLAQ